MMNPVAFYFAKKVVERNVLSTGDFLLNSGTKSKFYYDFSRFSDSKGLIELGFVCYCLLLFHYSDSVFLGSFCIFVNSTSATLSTSIWSF